MASYSRLIEGTAQMQDIRTLWLAQFPHPQDTLIYLAKLNPNSETPLLDYYHSVQETNLWAFLAIAIMNLLFLGVIQYFRKKKWLYFSLLFINFGIFYGYRHYFLFQQWIFLPCQATVYEAPSFVARSYVEVSQPQMGLVIEKKEFWWKVENEHGTFWVPEFQVIK